MSELEKVIDQLAQTSVEEEILVSFAGKSLSLDTEEDAKEIVEAIKNCEGMTSLCLEGNTFGVPAAKAVAKALESQPNFRRALWKDMFTRRKETEVPDALNFLGSGIMLANAKLVEIDLSDNAFGPRGLRGVVNLLKSSSCYTLKELRLNNNGLGISGATMLATTLSQLLENSRKDSQPLRLKLFICGRNRLENEGSLALSQFLKDVGTLEYIAMPQNGIYHKGIEGLAKAFAANPGLTVLNINDNLVTEKGSVHIAQALSSLINLEMINFGDCLLRTKGTKIIASALKANCPKLKELILSYNEIGKEAIQDIVAAVNDKSLLETIELNGNQFGTEGCKLITESFKASILGPLNEDEGSENDEEEEDDGSTGSDGESEDGDGEESNSTQQNGDIHEVPLKLTFVDYFANPSNDSLVKLYKAKISILPELPLNATLKDYFNLFLRISDSVQSDSKDHQAAQHYTNQILLAAFQTCPSDEVWKFNNDFLVHLQLIKGEEKIKKHEDITNALILLQNAVQNEYFPNSTRDLLKLILSRPLRYTKAAPDALTSLLQTLYQYT